MKRIVHKEHADIFAKAARLAVKRAGWSPRYDLEILRPDRTARQTRYGYRADKVRLLDSPDLLSQVTAALGACGDLGLGNARDVSYDVVASRVYLQVGSFKVCPYSLYDYHEILDACADGLRSAGANEREVIDFTVAVTSFFIASVVSGVYAVEGPDPTGFRRGWPLDHLVSSVAGATSLRAYVALYANIQMRLWSDNWKLAQALKSRFAHPFDTIEFETDRGVSILLDTFEFVGAEEDGLAWRDDQEQSEIIISELKYNWRNWPIKAFQWAEMMAPYVIGDQEGRQLPPRSQHIPGRGSTRPSDEAQERRNQVRTENTQAIQGLPWLDESGYRQVAGLPAEPYGELLVRDTQFRDRLLNIGIGAGRSPRVMSFEVLDALYRGRAEEVEIESQVTRKTGMAYEIAHMAREEVGPFLPGFNNIDWGATRIDPDGKLQLYEKRIPVTDQTPAKLDKAGFPDLLFIIDSSGSMGWNPRAGTGPYDSLLRAIYSVFDFLEKQHKAQYMKFAVANFSATTLKTPWHPFAELRKVKELLFRHQGGGTKLDCGIIRQIASTSQDRFLCLMVTDARIGNSAEVLNAVSMMANRGHGFVFIQIGRPSPLTEQISQAGLPMHVINDHRQLQGLCLEYARKTW
jgi:hypothetical protein